MWDAYNLRMKKNIIRTAFVAAFALMAGYSVYTSQQKKNISELALANVEALADNEENPLCPNGCFDNGKGCYCYQWYPTYREAQ